MTLNGDASTNRETYILDMHFLDIADNFSKLN